MVFVIELAFSCLLKTSHIRSVQDKNALLNYEKALALEITVF